MDAASRTARALDLEPVETRREEARDIERHALGTVGDGTRELLEEERVAVGPREDARCVGGLESVPLREQFRRRLGGEPAEAQRDLREIGSILEELVSSRADQEYRSCQRLVEELEQVEERRLGPMQVLEHDHERAVGGE